jgi:branched-chain amino acid transport system ATP-binding protein
MQEVFEIIDRLREQGTTILLVEQNAQEALSIADKGYVLEAGRIVLCDRGLELLGADQVKDAYLGHSEVARDRA